MNDFVVRFMSSKMNEVNDKCPKEETKDAEKNLLLDYSRSIILNFRNPWRDIITVF